MTRRCSRRCSTVGRAAELSRSSVASAEAYDRLQCAAEGATAGAAEALGAGPALGVALRLDEAAARVVAWVSAEGLTPRRTATTARTGWARDRARASRPS